MDCRKPRPKTPSFRSRRCQFLLSAAPGRAIRLLSPDCVVPVWPLLFASPPCPLALRLKARHRAPAKGSAHPTAWSIVSSAPIVPTAGPASPHFGPVRAPWRWTGSCRAPSRRTPPLSAAASRDALLRLQALNLSAPSTLSSAAQAALPAGGWILRVAHGQALGGYIGASIELRMSGPTAPPVRAWLALVETLPAGTEGSPVRRNLVRNVLIPAWDGQETLSNQDRSRFYESRPMSIPAGARPERLRVVGWVEDAQGRIRAIAQTQCTSDGERW
jgi:hypothetical protein